MERSEQQEFYIKCNIFIIQIRHDVCIALINTLYTHRGPIMKSNLLTKSTRI